MWEHNFIVVEVVDLRVPPTVRSSKLFNAKFVFGEVLRSQEVAGGGSGVWGVVGGCVGGWGG